MLDKLALAGIIPVIKVKDAADAVPLCAALERGGLPVAEITFRTAAAAEAIRLVHEHLPGVLLGAGTVLTPGQADEAWAAGAGYLVTPGFNPKVVGHALDKGYAVLPGCSGPSDVEAALSFGLRAVKFFPAEAAGGVKMIKSLLGPYSEVRFVPTGGISDKNLMEYLAVPQVLACGGSWMVPEDAIAGKDWGRVERLAREAVLMMLGLELRGLRLWARDDAQARDAANRLGLLLGWPVSSLENGGQAVGGAFEITSQAGAGQVTIGCNSAARARWHLEQRGFRFDEGSAVYGPDGRLREIGLAGELLGLSLRLRQQ